MNKGQTTINIAPDPEGTKAWILEVAKSDLPMAVRMATYLEGTPQAINMAELAEVVEHYHLPYREWREGGQVA